MSDSDLDVKKRWIDNAEEILKKLDAIPDPWLREILNLHSTGKEKIRGLVYCLGCDMGCSCEAASWPCSTVLMIARWYDIDIPKYCEGLDFKGALNARLENEEKL